jgi:multiple sugar transport system permease protein
LPASQAQHNFEQGQAFLVGIMGGNLPMGAAVSLCMVPILAVAATFILRGIFKRGSEV